MVIEADVVVVGAGPAGVAAATHLARAGRTVLVADKAHFPRDKCCGDGLTTLALRELERLGFRPDTVPSWQRVDGAWLRAPSGREFHVPLPDDGIAAAVAPRHEFDHALVQLAKEAGVDLREGLSFASLDVGDAASSGVTVTFDAVDADRGARSPVVVRAGHVIAADGAWSPVRKALGATPAGYRGEWQALRAYVGHVDGPAAERMYVWFDADLLPGYAWSFPLPDGRVNLGFGVLRSQGWSGRAVASAWDGLVDRPHVRAALGPRATVEGRMTAWPIPARIGELPLQMGPVVFVGDAAAATDVMTGEGIGQALLTGRLAAEAIEHDPAAAGPRYEQAVRRELVADHRMSVLLGRVLARRRGAAGALWIVAHSGRWGRAKFARWMFEDEPRAAAVTPRRWHRSFLRRPSPYAGR